MYCGQQSKRQLNLNREGRSHPANMNIRALGDISPGRPLKRVNCTVSELEVMLISIYIVNYIMPALDLSFFPILEPHSTRPR